MKKAYRFLFLVLFLFVAATIIVLFSTLFGNLNYMKETNYQYDFFEGDYLLNEKDYNINLMCKTASPFYFRVAFGKNQHFYTNYYDSLIVKSIEAYYIKNHDTIFINTRLYYELELMEANMHESINLEYNKPIHWVEFDIPNKVRKGKFEFFLRIIAKDLKSSHDINIQRKFNIESGSKFGYKGMPFMPN